MNTYYSQCEQDKFLNEEIFKGYKDGNFVDVGAHNGIFINNSYFFENNGWKGICIEPLPHIFNELVKNRPKAINLNCAVCDIENEEMDFISLNGYTEMLSGICKFTDKRHFERMNREIAQNGGSYEIIKVKTRRLDNILSENNINHVHYLSIDVEGAENAVIKSIDFDKVFIDVIGFEDNYSDVSVIIKTYLQSKGYIYIKNHGHDIFMIHKNSEFFKL